MSSFFSSVNTNSSYSYLFSSLSSSSSSGSSNGIFSGGNSLLGDYSMIQSGTYKKLLTAYYKTQDSTSSDSEKESTESTDSTNALTNVKTDANALKESTEALSKTSLYRSTGVDEDGNKTYDTDAIKSAVKTFVSSYNSYVKSAGSVDSLGILSKALGIEKSTASNKGLLKEIGITVGSNNQLVLDETKLDSAAVSTLTSLFTGNGSYGDAVGDKASESYKLANNAAFSNTHASSYTYNGAYSTLGTSNGLINKYL